jgi:hypothetical protein
LSTTYKHLSKTLDWREAECGHVMTGKDSLPTSNPDAVTCPDCKAFITLRAAAEPSPREQMRRAWTIAAVAGDTDLGFDQWSRGVGGSTPNLPDCHTPPRMEDERGITDGVFIFHDAHITNCTLEVVPQLSGNVEMTVAYGDDGNMFSLSHLDRADLLRALLYEFHYSREVGGPADDQD